MHIKTITCHHVYNYGASLQAYGLQEFCKSKGHSYEIINFVPHYHQIKYNMWAVSQLSRLYPLLTKIPILKYPYGVVKNFPMLKTWGRKKAFDDFTEKYLQIGFEYNTSEELKKNPPVADVYIAGSDQIWNTDYENGTEPAYFLDFGNASTLKVSYAASFGVSVIPEDKKSFIAKKLENFDRISVREKSGIDILDKFGIKDATQVIDPVFLLTCEEWNELANKASISHKIRNNGYILVYDFLNDIKIKQAALLLKNKYQLPIVSINDLVKMRYADMNVNNAGPLEFVKLIKNARFVVSNSFHATAFSIIMNKSFFTYSLKTQNNSSRMTDLLMDLGIEGRFNVMPGEINEIDYQEINKRLVSIIEKSKEYLINILT